MVEIELKFQVPATHRAAVQRAVDTATAHRVRLRAQYFDTPDRRLAAAGIALRLRQEDRRWVQTLKGRGDGQVRRLEHEVVLPPARNPPAVDIARHAGTPAGAALVAALDGQVQALHAVFETDVHRTLRRIRSGGAQIELAFDRGVLRAGDASAPLCELELELKGGALAGLFDAAALWVARHDLWLDVRTKAERGDRLARGLDAGAAIQASMPVLTDAMTADAALRAIVACCLDQVLPNVADLAAGVGGVEHLHQARVGLRRLRSALRLYGDWSAAIDPAWLPALAALCAPLGRARDRDALAESLLPELRAAGAPLAELPAGDSLADATAALRAAPCSTLLLQLIAFAQRPPAADGAAHDAAPAGRAALRARAEPRLEGLYRQLRKDARGFDELDDTRRHRARKRLKRLRYGIEFIATAYPPEAVARALARLRPAQDALGRYRDLGVAQALFEAQRAHDPRAWFALGWLAARRAPLLRDAGRALAVATRRPRQPWS